MTLPKALYHVTALSRMESIRRLGLLPRLRCMKPSLYGSQSCGHFVLLCPPRTVSTILGSVWMWWKEPCMRPEREVTDDDKIVVLQVETSGLDPEVFVPDEAWVYDNEVWRNPPPGDERAARCRERRAEWWASLTGMGEVGYDAPIPPALLTEVLVLDPMVDQARVRDWAKALEVP